MVQKTVFQTFRKNKKNRKRAGGRLRCVFGVGWVQPLAAIAKQMPNKAVFSPLVRLKVWLRLIVRKGILRALYGKIQRQPQSTRLGRRLRLHVNRCGGVHTFSKYRNLPYST